jgi:LmbE family N-acetylglucosaminyl deacetylase
VKFTGFESGISLLLAGIFNMKKALFIAVHPDDETLGCGGTILKFKELGWRTYWLILTDVFPGMGWSDEFINRRKVQIETINKTYAFTETKNLGFPTTTLNELSFGKLIEGISSFVHHVQPDWIFLPFRSDVHSDHRKGFEATFSVCKSFRTPFISRILMYECISETEYAPSLSETSFIPNTFIDITKYFKKKLDAMEIYESEIYPPPFPRSHLVVESLARFRGSRMGVHYAEAFSMLFEAIH